jgi:acyl-CoA hydrolase
MRARDPAEHRVGAIQRELSFRFLAQPTDVNFGGKVHGGAVMKWIDQAAYAAAVGWSGAYCVTAALSGLQFIAPILIGDLVTVQVKLIRTGRSSMHFAVDVLARGLKAREQRLATSCVIVFVALDEADGKPVPVPSWQPQSADDLRLAESADELARLSKAMESAMLAARRAG